MADHAHPVNAEAVSHASERAPDLATAEALAEVLGLMAEPTRLRVLFALDEVEELCVGDLVMSLGASPDAVGYALKVLRSAGLVQRRREGRMAFYRLSGGFPEPFRQHCMLRLLELRQGRTPQPPDDGLD